MEVIIQAGMASRFFLTDLERGLATIASPHAMISKERISINRLAEIFEKASNSSIMRKGLLGALIKKADAKDIGIFLEELANNKKLSKPIIGVPPTLFIISNGIEKQALNAMKVLKLRGLCQLLAVNISSMQSVDSMAVLEAKFSDLYKSSKKLLVVANLYETVVSTEQNIKNILSNHPELISVPEMQNINNMDNFFEEGKYDR